MQFCAIIFTFETLYQNTINTNFQSYIWETISLTFQIKLNTNKNAITTARQLTNCNH